MMLRNENAKLQSIVALLGLFVALLSTLLAVQAAASTKHANAASRAERNRRAVVEFYEAGLNRKDYAAAARYFGSQYIQHNPEAEDGPEGFRNFVALLNREFPSSHSEIRQVFADGDFVILHVLEKLHPQDRGNAIVDIFRLKNGKIVEHWDVKQAIPEHTNNPNGMF